MATRETISPRENMNGYHWHIAEHPGHVVEVVRAEPGRWCVWHLVPRDVDGDPREAFICRVPGAVDPTTGRDRVLSAAQAKRLAAAWVATLEGRTRATGPGAWHMWTLQVGELTLARVTYPGDPMSTSSYWLPRELSRTFENARDIYRRDHHIDSTEAGHVRVWCDDRQIIGG